jgi:hypothetical protein
MPQTAAHGNSKVKRTSPSSASLTTQNSLTTESGCGSNFVHSAPSKLNVNDPQAVFTVNERSPSTENFPRTFKATFPTEPVTPQVEELCKQWLRNNFTESTSEEVIFVLTVQTLGFNTAAEIAAILHSQCQRPLQELRAMMSVPAQSCNEQNAKRKPLSNSSASSRKRSSTG